MKRKAKWATGLLVLSLVVYGVYIGERNSSLGKNFDAIRPGETKADVIGSMGPPDVIRSTCEGVTWLGEPVSKPCSSEFQYKARFMFKYWTIGFDESGMAVAKYRYVSP